MNSQRYLGTIVRKALNRNTHLINSSLVVAVSGGPDSTALLYCLADLKDDLGLLLHVAHLNHDFRGKEAQEDALFTTHLAIRLGLPYTVEKVDTRSYQKHHGISSFEEAARFVRYDFLSAVAKDVRAAAIALGHTANDQVETILMHIIRGTGLKGLNGMSEISSWYNPRKGSHGTLFRPFLQATRQHILTYCKNMELPFREDSTNISIDLTRNRIRHELIPLLETYNPRIHQSISRLARIAISSLDFSRTEVDKIWSSISETNMTSISFRIGKIKTLHPYIQGLLFQRAYKELSGDLRRLAEHHIASMVKIVTNPVGSKIYLPKGLTCWIENKTIKLGLWETSGQPEQYPAIVQPYTLNIQGTTCIPGWIVRSEMIPVPSNPKMVDPMASYFDLDALGTQITLRTRQPGDRFHPIGMARGKSLNRFLIDEKIPLNHRDALPLLMSDQNIIWVVPFRSSEIAKVKTGTKRAVKIRWYRDGSDS